MRLFTFCFSLTLALCAVSPGAEPQPLHCVPQEANLVVRIENPRLLVDSITEMDMVRQLQQLPFVRERLQSQDFQRFLQLVSYYEHELGVKWPEFLDRVAGRGITLASKAGDDNAPVLFVIEGRDEALTHRFMDLAVSLFEQELARQESKEKLERPEYRGIKGVKIGDLVIAQVGPMILASNKTDVMKRALDLHFDGGKSLADLPGPREARKALPADCLTWMWLNLDLARNAPNAKETFAQPSDNAIVTVLFGGWLDVVRRSPFLAAGLCKDNDKFGLTLRFPGGGHEGQPEQMLLHSPPKGAIGTLKPLEPKGVIFSHCFWFDFKALWEKRSKLFNDKIAKQFEDGEKQIRPFLPGMSLANLFAQSGPTHRFVAAVQEKASYSTKPKQILPNFAFVTSMRDKQFAKSMEGVLRAAALFGGRQLDMKLVDEEHNGVKIVGYRFSEDKPNTSDPDGIRFNFSPCFATVGDQFAVCSTIEFGREIVDLLKKEQAQPNQDASPSPLRSRLYGNGAVDLMRAFQDQVLGQIILDQAVKPEEGRRQMGMLEDWVRRLGQLEFRSEYLEKEYRFDIEWRRAK
jgi:hypothetical protein